MDASNVPCTLVPEEAGAYWIDHRYTAGVKSPLTTNYATTKMCKSSRSILSSLTHNYK